MISKILDDSISKIEYRIMKMGDQVHPECLLVYLLPFCPSLCLFVLKPLDYSLRYCVTGEFERRDKSNPCFGNSSVDMLWKLGFSSKKKEKSLGRPCEELRSLVGGWQRWVTDLGWPWLQPSLPATLPWPYPHSGLLSWCSLPAAVGSNRASESALRARGAPSPASPTWALPEVGHPRPACFPGWLCGFWRMAPSLLRAAMLRLLGASVLCWHSAPRPWGCELISES